MPRQVWNSLASRASIALSLEQLASFEKYLDLLLEANQKVNLTGITDRAEAEIQHVADSLTVLPHLAKAAHRLADIGSGGGVPGIVLAIARPDAKVVLIESTKKKADFLVKAARELKLANVQVVAKRAEDVGRTPMRETFDVVVARAVAEMDVLVEWMLPLLKIGGNALAMKGPKVYVELPRAKEMIRLLGGGAAQILPAGLPDTSGHLIVKIPKLSRTNPRYPRAPTAAKKKTARPD